MHAEQNLLKYWCVHSGLLQPSISAGQDSHPLPAAEESINDQLAKDDFIGSAADLFKIRLLSHLETFSTTGLMRRII